MFWYNESMKYQHIVHGTFIERPNRFVAHVEIAGRVEKVHVKNTGRCRELLVSGADVYLEDFSERMGSRKLRYSLISVGKPTAKELLMVNMDSQAPNKVVREALENGTLLPGGLHHVKYIKSEYRYGKSRLDFYAEDSGGHQWLAEVKGVTLEENGVARFPDAPTERGIRHIEELITAVGEGYYACIIFVIQMKGVASFEPNYLTHREFGEALERAKKAGVEVLAYDCQVTADTLTLDKPVPVNL